MSKTKGALAIEKSAIGFTMVTIISLVISFGKESVLAYFFGTSAEMDAYTLATQLPVTLFSIVSVAINTVVIPNYSNELIKHNKAAADAYASNFMTILFCLSTGLSAICIIAAPVIISIIAPGLSAEYRILCVAIFRMVVPTIVLTQMIQINSGIMNVYDCYVRPAFCIVISNICIIVLVFFCNSGFGIYAAAVGTIVGCSIEYIYSVVIRRRYMQCKWNLNKNNIATHKSFKMAGPICIGIGAAEINKIIDRIIASLLATGSISALGYASKLSSAVSALMIKAITTIAFPQFAKSAAANDKRQLAERFLFSLRLYVIILTPVIWGGFFLRKEIVRIIFMRGMFGIEALELTAPLFACYLVCLLFTAIRQNCSNYYYSLGNSIVPMKNSLIGIGINIILNVILAYYLQAFGLALATTISTGIISVLLLIDVARENEFVIMRTALKACTNTVVAVSGMAIILFVVKRIFLLGGVSFQTIQMNCLIYILVSVVIGASSYLGLHILLKTSEVEIIIKRIKHE